tara:strand:+ start:1213 stop:2007 length:795 start_codon:yes stop_codon:yes gene_type:complete
MNFYDIEFSRNPLNMWNKLKTKSPVKKEGYNSLYDFCKATSRYHFDETVDDIAQLDTDCPPIIPIGNIAGDWDQEVKKLSKETTPATFGFRTTTRADITNAWEENDFKKWGYNIDGGYTIANRTIRPELEESLQFIVDSFGFEKPGVVKFDVQMPGQCFYWHLDNFGGVLKRRRKEYNKSDEGDLDQRKVMRTVIFLDDQQQGQVWQQGNLLLGWKRGDIITWPWRDIPHGTCNYGHKPRPVLNITGILTDKTREFLTSIKRVL